MDAAGAKNQAIYDDLWVHYDLFPHDGWWAWGELGPRFAAATPARTLEIGPGKFPHVPIAGTNFIDLSRAALSELSQHGGRCARATTPLPFADGAFDLVCAFEVFEHVNEDEALFAEIQRVLAPGGELFDLLSPNTAYSHVIVTAVTVQLLKLLLHSTAGITVGSTSAQDSRALAGGAGARVGGLAARRGQGREGDRRRRDMRDERSDASIVTADARRGVGCVGCGRRERLDVHTSRSAGAREF